MAFFVVPDGINWHVVFFQRRMVANGIRVFDDKPWNLGCLRIMAIVAAMFIFRVLAH